MTPLLSHLLLWPSLALLVAAALRFDAFLHGRRDPLPDHDTAKAEKGTTT